VKLNAPNVQWLTHDEHQCRAILLSPALEIYDVTTMRKDASGALNSQ